VSRSTRHLCPPSPAAAGPRRFPLLAGALLAAGAMLAAPGCALDAELAIGCLEQESLGDNGRMLNGRYLNGRNLNGINLQGLDLGEVAGCGQDALHLLKYVVGCALPADQEVTVIAGGEAHVLAGALGLAPEWADDPCDEVCQGWISACLIARTNARGESIEISMRGDHPALALEPGEADAFPLEEATYYGDLFADPVQLSACLPEGGAGLDRVCGEYLDCPVAIAGSCADLCDDTGCRDADGHHYPEVIQVFRDLL
jgi:hypothetical protein